MLITDDSPGISERHHLAENIRPNFLFIYVDDLAPWALGCYGNKDSHTPNLDHLAGSGLRMDGAYATSPVCSPARASMLTSRFSSEHGIHDFITAPKHPAYTPEVGKAGLPAGMMTFPEVLAANGYTNTLIGKWHVGDWTQDPSRAFHPTNHGYHEFMGLTGGGVSPKDPLLEKNGTVQRMEGLCDDIVASEAISILERKTQSPFFLSVNFRAPHSPWMPVSDEDQASCSNMDPTIPEFPGMDVDRVKSMMRDYLTAISGLDRNVGRLLDALQRLGLEGNTIVIFSSDHGFAMGHNGIWHKGNAFWVTHHRSPPTRNIPGDYRPNLYATSLRVPGIIRWPNHIKSGSVIKTPFMDVDWFPTVLAMAGLPIPNGVLVRGQNALPLLTGKTADDGVRETYAEYDMQVYARADLRCISDGQWKLVVDFFNPWRTELYHIAHDPDESANLAGSSQLDAMQALSRLGDRLLERMEEHDDYLLTRMSARPMPTQ